MAYSKAVIAIPNVSGNIVVNVTTSAAINNLFDSANAVYNSRTDSSGVPKPAGERAGALVTNPIAVNNTMNTLQISGITEVYNSALQYYIKVVGYDSSDSTILQVAYNTATYSYNIADAFVSRPSLDHVRFVIVLKNNDETISTADTANLIICST